MKFLLSVTGILFLLIIITVFKINELKKIEYKEPELLTDKKILTVYYSNGGNTKEVAQNLHAIAGGDIAEIKLNEQYPNNIFKMSKIVREQIKQGYLPKIDYSPSLPVKSFLKNNNFENKILIPFFTYSGGANKNKSVNEIKLLTNAKDIKNVLFVFENGIFLKKEQIIKWLNNI